MRPISEKQKQILQFIQEYTASEGYPPAVREIAAAVGLRSPSSVHAHVKHLRELGYLEQCAGKTRTVKITGQTGTTAVPLLGRVAAGQPILAVEEQQAMLYIDLHGKSGSYFALHVRGDSMVNAGILSGDTVIIRPQETAENGQIVVALLDDSATVKRLRRDETGVWLLPENPAYAPIDGREAAILGVVVALQREY